MNEIGIAGWSLTGILTGACLRLVVQRFALLPSTMTRLAPPVILEAVTAVLFAALAWRIGLEPALFAYSWLAAVGVPLAAIDWSTKELPSRLIWPSAVVLVALFSMAAAVNHDVDPLIRAAAGMLVLLAFYGAIYFLRPGQLGGGDVRLGGLLGIAAGWMSWSAIFAATFFGWLLAAVVWLLLRATRRTPQDLLLPLGPFLLLGALIAVGVRPT